MQGSGSPVVKDLVLVGGGHAHVAVLKRFGMRPLPGVRLTLITRDVHTPYSGMLPGYIAGHYGYDDCHVDLRALAQFAGARLYHAEVEGLDLDSRRVLCRGRPPVAYDLLSINTGSRPGLDVPGAAEHAVPVKPIDRFLAYWERVRRRALDAGGALRFLTVGAGAGGVELTLSVQHRLQQELAGQSAAATPTFEVLSADETILPTHNARVRARFERILHERAVRVHAGARAAEVTNDAVVCEDGTRVPYDVLFWVTNAAAPDWPCAAGLATDDRGFIQVDDELRSISHPEVFAAGDVASPVRHPRPKSGVFAVRQGPALTVNLRRALTGRRPKPFRPQRHFLSLIGTGAPYAVASRGRWAAEGRWVWRWKDWIDRRWMAKYNELPEMESDDEPQVARGVAGPEAMQTISALAMRCGGCGAKVGAGVLERVLARLDRHTVREDVLVGLDDPDDAAVLEVPAGRVAVQTIDYFRAFVDDPYLFGRIAANHSLGDIYAMGAEPQSALALATLPYGLEAKVEQQLYELLSGAVEVLDDAGAVLAGGHTGEGAELAFGLAVSGLAERERLMRKAGMSPGEYLVLTKPLGTGTLFAADMRHHAKGRWVQAALETMQQSNRVGAEILVAHGAHACTDVTGFGLLGHLVEMTRPSQVDAEIDLDALPVLAGALECMREGIFSSLQPENVRLRRAIRNQGDMAGDERYPLLFDPQTAGGLLASVPAEHVEACVEALQAGGYRQAAVIGEIRAPGEAIEPITLRRGGAQSSVTTPRSEAASRSGRKAGARSAQASSSAR